MLTLGWVETPEISMARESLAKQIQERSKVDYKGIIKIRFDEWISRTIADDLIDLVLASSDAATKEVEPRVTALGAGIGRSVIGPLVLVTVAVGIPIMVGLVKLGTWRVR